jgi:hypothetical protein
MARWLASPAMASAWQRVSVDAPDTAPARDPAGGWRTWWPWVAAVVLVALCVLPILWSGFDGAGKEWRPAGDWSVLELRTRDVGSTLTPLLGPYSRFGWNHPGPLLFWAFAVPYRLLGQSSSSMLLVAALVNFASVIATAAFAWRRGRLPLVAATVGGLALLCTHLGPSFLRDPWNPSITVLPFALAVVLAWSAWEGDRVALPVLAFTGSFLVQSHIGFAALVAALWAIGVVGFWRTRDAEERPRAGRTLAWSAGVVAACWLPVVVDQLFGTGNLTDLAAYFRGGSAEGPAGWATAAGVLAREIGAMAPWLGGDERGGSVDGGLVTASLGSLFVPLVAFVGSGVVAWRRGARSAVRLQVVVATSTLVGYVSVARITGPVFAYLVRWLWVLALLWWVSVFWSLWSATFGRARAATVATERSPGRSPATWALVVLTVLALVVVARTSARTVSGIDRIGTPDGEWYVTLDSITDDVVAGVPRDGPILVRAVGSANGSIADALRLQLDRAGVPVVVVDDEIHKYGDGRSARARPPAAVMTVASGATLTGPFGETFGSPIARWDPLAPDERQYATALEDRLADQLSRVGRADLVTAVRSGGGLDGVRDLDGVDQDLFRMVERYRRQGDPVTVYVERDVTDLGLD